MKRLYIIALFVFASGFASAQENGNRDAQNRIVRGPYETNRFFDNVFVGVAGGVNLYFGENDSEGKFGKRLAPAMDIHVGKWFTPSIGARVGYAGLQAKGWTSAGTLYAKSADGGLFREKFGVMYLHADAMWNFSNAVSGYKESRTWNFVPFVGVGWARSYGNDAHDNEIGFDAGLLNVVRLCSSLDLTLEARCLLVNQRFDGVTGGRTGEGMLSVTAGLAIYDTMQYIKCDVSTICVGLAASMGAFLLSSGTKGKRIALPNAEIMIHQPSAGTQGKVTDMESDVEHFLKIKQRLNKILAENTGKTPEQVKLDSERDHWMTADEAQAYGLVDKVIYKR